uniref:Uncharacterized protein n=1 Tax=Anguilla anguilla TaxID=7936 RepID=A0A0E9S1X8_ANGAN
MKSLGYIFLFTPNSLASRIFFLSFLTILIVILSHYIACAVCITMSSS